MQSVFSNQPLSRYGRRSCTIGGKGKEPVVRDAKAKACRYSEEGRSEDGEVEKPSGISERACGRRETARPTTEGERQGSGRQCERQASW